MKGPFRPWLYIRLSLFSLLVLILAGLAIFAVIGHFSGLATAESLQRQNLGLARYIAANYQSPALLDRASVPNETSWSRLIRNVRRINPTLEIYLLSLDGKVLAHSRSIQLSTSDVDLAPVKALAERRIAGPELPLLGDDPHRPERQAVISVASLSIEETMTGYLYIVLDGAVASAVAGSVFGQAHSNMLTTMLGLVAGVIGIAGLVLALILKSTLQPLTRLTERVRAFRGPPASTPGVQMQVTADVAETHRQSGFDRADEIELLDQATVQMQRRIADQFEGLARAEQQRRELINQVTHDLQTPLASVRGYVETLLLDGDPIAEETRTAYLKTALRQTRLLSQRVSDLFEFSNLQAGTTPFVPDRFSLAELVHDVVGDYQLQSQNRQLALTVAPECLVPAAVEADIGLVERALRNLLDNSIRHTPVGGRITVNILLEPSNELNRICLRVDDNGEGVSEEALSHIFELAWTGRARPAAAPSEPVSPLLRESGSPPSRSMRPTSAAGRTGLGLHIVRQIALLHGAEPRVRSTTGEGACFELSLALSSAQDGL